MDRITRYQRSRVMACIPSKNTSPEMRVRRLLHRRGFRYRTNVGTLPGSPDLVLSRFKLAIFVHGCFWHRHDCPRGRSLPSTNSAKWTAKLERNKVRDNEARRGLEAQGWRTLVIWECETKNEAKLVGILAKVLCGSESTGLWNHSADQEG